MNMALRQSLKKGRATEAFSTCEIEDASLGKILHMASDIRPNQKNIDRFLRRIAKMNGVVYAGRTKIASDFVFVVRNFRTVTNKFECGETFSEPQILYSFFIFNTKKQLSMMVSRIGVIRHAIERVVERSKSPVDRPILGYLDKDIVACFTRLYTQKIEFKDSDFLISKFDGLWTGSVDTCLGEPDWPIEIPEDKPLQMFSVRTFLPLDDLSPMLTLQWSNAEDEFTKLCPGIAGSPMMQKFKFAST